MGDNFAGFPIAGWTRHFLITYTYEGDAAIGPGERGPRHL